MQTVYLEIPLSLWFSTALFVAFSLLKTWQTSVFSQYKRYYLTIFPWLEIYPFVLFMKTSFEKTKCSPALRSVVDQRKLKKWRRRTNTTFALKQLTLSRDMFLFFISNKNPLHPRSYGCVASFTIPCKSDEISNERPLCVVSDRFNGWAFCTQLNYVFSKIFLMLQGVVGSVILCRYKRLSLGMFITCL